MWAKQQNSGFTIVELLIVIIVIAILGAITIVAYTSIQNRAKTSAGRTLANHILKKAELYYTNKGVYITSFAQFDEYPETKVASADSIYISCTAWTSSTYNTTPAAAGNIPAGAANGQRVRVCGSTTGGNGYYWDYTTGSEVAIHYGQ